MHHAPQKGAPLQALQNCDLLSTDTSAMDPLHAFLRQRREAHEPVEALDAFAQALHQRVVAAERAALRRALSRCALDVPVVAGDGVRCPRVLRCATTYTSAVGPVRVERSLYRHPDEEQTVCPLALRAGIIEGAWTPLAAKQAPWVVAHLPPKEGEDLFDLLGNMAPSQSTLDRLPKALSVHWEAYRPPCEATLRQQETIPPEAVTLAVALDGVRAPMQEGQRQAKRTQARAQGQPPSGPAGYQEVECATVSYYDREGERLYTRRMARMPETKKTPLKQQWTAEVMGALAQRPDVQVVTVADDAPDTWRSLGATLPCGGAVLDLYHAAEPLGTARGAAYGAGTPTYQERFEPLRTTLRDAPQGADTVIRALGALTYTRSLSSGPPEGAGGFS